ncbi:MAG: copper chaperone PCu(A)C [Pseudomonadota bacterium]
MTRPLTCAGAALATAAALALSLAIPVATASDMKPAAKVGALEIIQPYARATPPKAPVAGGYLVVRNTGDKPDWLIGGDVDFAGRVEVHEMAVDSSNIMRMRKLADGIEVPPGQSVTLKPGGLHVMFMQLREPLKAGEPRSVTLRFKEAGDVTVPFAVLPIGETPATHSHEGHGTTN